MDSIYINTDVLENKILKLEELRERCMAACVQARVVQGSGDSVEAVRDTDKAYMVIQEKLHTLLSNSVLFFRNIRESVIEADQLAADEINRGGI